MESNRIARCIRQGIRIEALAAGAPPILGALPARCALILIRSPRGGPDQISPGPLVLRLMPRR